MKHKIFVDGQEGTTGLRINEYLAKRDDVEVLRIDPDKRKDAAARRALLNAADVAFLCLPDAASKESVALVDNPGTLVIDASTAFRTHADWAYGLPELAPGQRDLIRKRKRVAVPGCHATAFVLPLRPLVQAELVPPGTQIHAHSITGYSGGGKKMIADYERGDNPKLTSPRPYALGLAHKHLPEMKAHTGINDAPIFTPIVAGFYKGLAVTTYLHPRQMGTTLAELHACLQNYYKHEPLIAVKPLGDDGANLDDGFLDVQACNDSNRVDIFLFGSDERAVLVARLDNLGKGASGAAVQCMNVHLGLPDDFALA